MIPFLNKSHFHWVEGNLSHHKAVLTHYFRIKKRLPGAINHIKLEQVNSVPLRRHLIPGRVRTVLRGHRGADVRGNGGEARQSPS